MTHSLGVLPYVTTWMQYLDATDLVENYYLLVKTTHYQSTMTDKCAKTKIRLLRIASNAMLCKNEMLVRKLAGVMQNNCSGECELTVQWAEVYEKNKQLCLYTTNCIQSSNQSIKCITVQTLYRLLAVKRGGNVVKSIADHCHTQQSN